MQTYKSHLEFIMKHFFLLGVLYLTWSVYYKLPEWMLSPNIGPLLGMNIAMVTAFLLFNIWKNHGASIYISLFHGVKSLIESVPKLKNLIHRIIKILYTLFGVLLNLLQKPGIMAIVKSCVFGLLVQYCISPAYHLLWLHSSVCYRFVRDLKADFKERFKLVKPNENYTIKLPFVGYMLITSFLLPPVIIFKLTYSFTVLQYQTIFVSKAYVIITIFYEILATKTLEDPLTKILQRSEIGLDYFEGLEKHFVKICLQGLEMILYVIFILWVLVIGHQTVMFIGLLMLYKCGRYFSGVTITEMLVEWTLIANFERASMEELNKLEDVCPVCLAHMKFARKTPCNHYFHGRCLKECLRDHVKCPMCNQQFEIH